ncbi:uncharacterized protein V1516DRAFT_642958 [Lipomyces oligophaga]|uniref:uncharacterized protein n=1 Tax=Lipomyces oligophaga TaxID=45792 RepID=UPI0034CE4EFC
MSDFRLSYWENTLRNPTLAALPTDYVRPTPIKVVESKYSFPLSASILSAWNNLALLSGCTEKISPYTIALTAFVILVYRLTGDEDIVVGADSEKSENIVVRAAVDGKITFQSLLETVQKLEMEGSAKSIPFADFIDYLQKKTKASEPPTLYRLSFLHAGRSIKYDTLAPIDGLVTDLTIFFDLPEKSLNFHYNSLLFKNERVSILAEQLSRIIILGSAEPSIAIGSIPLITPRQSAVLPDPTRDLHWGNFRGPIHDIFSANAKRHPNRLCVLETKNPFDNSTHDRPFTYQQIDEASNILAHHLISKGISLGDVVTVYAYRGVDLVVSVMGVLKAGATFSVIDPAYPAARQNIYLTVAQPRGLIVIKKAGQLAQSVRKYIDTELSLLADIPALEIRDDGTLVGGSDNVTDLLADQAILKSKPTGVIVGPDSTPTLSFTSGSEGIPKGVRGRHFSLTYYFPWMSETFGLSENDKFTMLSGIAHDPIQRDIFTPLFLGAHLLVPTADDIGTPGRLAEWMAENEATVTHLTPAMGQLLSAQAEAIIPSLHHAFFVGDILTKRDCLRLQALARNVFIVNMYGTTETQRAVSYFEVPSNSKNPTFMQSQKDVIVAGKGMFDVQLVVVNRYNRELTCGVGEVGEIYVRAGGLAEGYLRLPDLTKEKFVKSWFVPDGTWKNFKKDEPWSKYWFGPRDRLYRTGDLGRYTPDGNVECSGRADDQVKIRGFRIELGEIDTHLSQHPLVRENVTLVKRDKDEEPTLISYIVPQKTDSLDELLSGHESLEEESDPVVKGLVKYRRLIRDIREYLKLKLPSYAVPTVIVPMARMPLNPNGKVDKPALPFPDTAQLAAVAKRTKAGSSASGEELFTNTEALIRDVWIDVLPQRPSSLSPKDSFFDVGGHSILATRMIFEVRKKFVVDLPLGFIYSHPTISELAKEIDSIKGKDLNVGSLGSTSASGTSTPKADEAVSKSSESEYASDAVALAVTDLASSYPSVKEAISPQDVPLTIFLTGATGFLGTNLVDNLLSVHGAKREIKLILHIRAKNSEVGLERFKSSAIAYGVWKDDYRPNIEIVIGSLEQEHLGLDSITWKKLTETVDVIIHNGAQVHWVYPYSKLRGPNVLGTIQAMALASEGKPKIFSFVSSTSAIDTEHYVRLSDSILSNGGNGILENDDLQGSKVGLANGYGQSKWASEYLVREAGRRGLVGSVVRAGYITGDSRRGITNTDDFIARMIKGCVQLGLSPDIYNTVNMVPVDHVSRIVISSAFFAPKSPEGMRVVHSTGHPRLRFNQFLSTIATYGYNLSKVDYVPWRIALEKYVVEEAHDSALYPLLHFVLDNLPNSTKAPELDDRHAVEALRFDSEAWGLADKSAGMGINTEIVGIYLAYLVEVGFLQKPSEEGTELPSLELPEQMRQELGNVGGRGGI